jgi:two-component system phosphate regulon sensor histidine kinase PhoR
VARFAPPAAIQLRRAQLTLILAALIPTVFVIALGIILLAIGRGTESLVVGVLVLAFCTTALTGYILGSIFVSRGAQVARFQQNYLSLVSHELRTPLTSILMFLDTLRDDRLTDPAEKRQCLDLLDQEVRRLDSLLERLLQLSRLQARRNAAFESEPIGLDEVIRDAVVALEAATLTDPVEVVVEVEKDLRVRGDRTALSQAVANLLINAWKYTPSHRRRISLRARASDRGHVEIAVRDNGPGIGRDEQRRIFDEFERGDAAQMSGRQGSGLGLAIVRAVVRAHRGRLTLSSKPGEGAEFRIRLPRAAA